ncbi:zinc finger protein Xfin-like [Argiope bruennichi]|uniref:Zinc finger protein 181 like protein n=1 Tax=Argiope bruennichi TaxID=94029 RepID=A0A8T0FQ23_ARGBR|nr:zinc finger protein Xfin-like [Argiope bruennichi]KAF8791560.1 Zinc finger protein 181 like protein [Argiope bruennichi]
MMSSTEQLGRSRRRIKKKECPCCISTSKFKKTYSKVTCTICKRSFASKGMLKAHEAKHHYFRHCPNCPKTFRRTRTFLRHLQSHLNIHPYMCKICLNFFSVKKLLLEHKEVHRNDKGDGLFLNDGPPFACNKCNAIFSSLYDSTVHHKNHVFRCGFCRKEVVAFSNSWDLTLHTRRVHAPQLERGLISTEPLVSTGAVNLHEDSDSDSMDDLTASDNESLADTDYSYQKEAAKPVYTLKRKDKFICFICYDLYPSSELLKAHMIAHKFYPCNLCPKFFADSETAEKHECYIAD